MNTLTCERTNPNFAAVAGWSVIVTNGSQPDAIKVNVDKDRSILGPMYVSNLGNIDLSSASRLFSSDGDLWYQDGTCASPLAAGVLSSRVVLTAPLARGPMCTTAPWSAIVSAPPVPNLNLLAPGDRFGLPGPCIVFVPGHYTQVPVIPDNATVYFQSGDYWFDNFGEWLIEDNVHVSAGHPGSVTVPSDACDDARSADPNAGGIGATFYLGGDSRIRLDDRGSLEMFARQQGNFFVNIQALSAADGYAPASNPGADRSLVRTRPVNSVHLVVRGLVWSPTSRIVFDNPHLFSTVHQLLGGVVTYQLWIGDTAAGGPTSAPDVVQPATGATDAMIRLRSTSTRTGSPRLWRRSSSTGRRPMIRTNASLSTRPGCSTDRRSHRVDGVGWEQVQRGVELPFDPRITIPHCTSSSSTFPRPPSHRHRGHHPGGGHRTARVGGHPGHDRRRRRRRRGLTGRVELLRGTIDALRDLGAEPFVVPAMGSHGGATAAGQMHMLESLGMTEESLGCEIRATMDTVSSPTRRAARPCTSTPTRRAPTASSPSTASSRTPASRVRSSRAA